MLVHCLVSPQADVPGSCPLCPTLKLPLYHLSQATKLQQLGGENIPQLESRFSTEEDAPNSKKSELDNRATPAVCLRPVRIITPKIIKGMELLTTVTVLYYPKLLTTSKERNKSSVPDVSASMRAETLPSSRKRQIAMLQLAALTRWEFEVMFSTESATNKTNGRNKSVNNDETFTIVTLC
uniref:Uncharacterized protein n=1 Tax=Timema poppense TaxID=170557 RepID=A0A7R9H8S0_TIMPO|nr:unnamed protein product [Timema poppensis]